MSAEIIPFAEAADRIRERRAAVMPADVFWAAAICCWPICLAVFVTQAVIEASFQRGGQSS